MKKFPLMVAVFNKFFVFSIIPLILSIGIAPVLPFVDAVSEPDDFTCRDGQAKVRNLQHGYFRCMEPSKADRFVQLGLVELVSEASEKTMEETMDEEPVELSDQMESTEFIEEGTMDEVMEEAKEMESKEELALVNLVRDYATGTITSVQDPGIGHESHQLAILLAPSENVYVGQLTFSATEQVQYVTLHGPLAEGEDNGQPIWSPDGETKYAITFVDQETNSGGWFFSGNALALHTLHETPFSATYSISYSELAPGDYIEGVVRSGTAESIIDPGIGHESHSLALLLPPSEDPYHGGILSYSASENIQLVALHGPLAEEEDVGQPIWSPDGETKFALTFVNSDDNMGTWTFTGNALAAHTMNPDGFTISYSVATRN